MESLKIIHSLASLLSILQKFCSYCYCCCRYYCFSCSYCCCCCLYVVYLYFYLLACRCCHQSVTDTYRKSYCVCMLEKEKNKKREKRKMKKSTYTHTHVDLFAHFGKGCIFVLLKHLSLLRTWRYMCVNYGQ